jgi:two-component system, OmpR family, response regulator MprA
VGISFSSMVEPNSSLSSQTAAPRILVVDDDPLVRGTISMFLQTEGYAVQTAADGVEALEQIGREPPAVVLLDMRMPVMDGWTFVHELRARDLAVPIIVMTAAQDARRWADELGASAYVPKPVSFPALIARIDQLCA